MATSRPVWQFWIDRGGTFTDCVGRDPRGGLHVVKVPSSDQAPVQGIRALLGQPSGALPACEVVLATTLGTNALLERRGATTALIVTRGFGDLLAIGDQTRPELFALHIAKDPLLPLLTLETSLRLDARGQIVEGGDDEALDDAVREALARGVTSFAISILHAHRAPAVELALAARVAALGARHVVAASQVGGEIGYLARTETALVDAYLTPLLAEYLAGLERALADGWEAAAPPASKLWVMQSSGDLVEAARFRGRDCLVSGPAAGVLAVAGLAARHRLASAIGLDIGGTSADVCFVTETSGGERELAAAVAASRDYETRVAGSRVRAPMLPLHTIAAGGGSLCRWDGLRLTVGPQSAGARPGPLCYGDPAATEPTLSDVNLVLGRLVADRFALPIEEARARAALAEMAARMRADGAAVGDGSVEALALGLYAISNASMAEAIGRITIERGRDPRESALVIFGGAGGLHACGVARALGIRAVVAPARAGVLAATGLAAGRLGWHAHRDGGARRLRADLPEAEARRLFEELDAELEELERAALDGARPEQPRSYRRLDLRYAGSDHALTLELRAAPGGDASAPGRARLGALRAAFAEAHRGLFGYVRDAELEVVALRVEVSAPLRRSAPASPGGPPVAAGAAPPAPRRRQRICTERGFVDAPVWDREALAAGQELDGPAVIIDDTTAVVVDAGFRAAMLEDGALLLRDHQRAEEPAGADRGAPADPVRLEVYGGLFMSVAEQMGVALRRTAVSTNIRERLDFSCAVFDARGGLVANAPHIPVHLGAMSETVRSLLRERPNLEPGAVFACNDPSAGGSHLPDITVITPVHDERGALRFFTASRGHHVDVGGITPGSMPPFSRTLAEEGVVLRHVPIVEGGSFREQALRELLAAGPYPARRVADNLADLSAQIAANRVGAQLLLARLARDGDELTSYLGHVQAHAALLVRRAIAGLALGERSSSSFRDQLDDGSAIAVEVRRDGDRLYLDFSGSAGVHPGNLNAPRAVTVAAVIYVLRCLVGAPIPLNSGCLEPIELVIPEGGLLDPPPGVAVCGGNVETSQRIVDVLLGALRLAAASQGTMNNLTLGHQGFAYYETLCGGAGATARGPGASAVHTHMTNTRITDPEVLEARFPLRLRRFAIRRGSGGAGRHPGGDGVVRELELLEPMQVAMLSQRRVCAPFGLAGGAAGAKGRNVLDGVEREGAVSARAEAGAILRIETPGGGGFGEPSG
ncbi:MAG: hydantoinase B/oxoprolinase family protein [Kofleriaceae bacterium]